MPTKPGKGKHGHGKPRPAESAALKHPFSIESAQNTIEENESCYSVALRDLCPSETQANCCEYLDSDNNWVGCQLASNLYTCTYQFEEKPINVCCY